MHSHLAGTITVLKAGAEWEVLAVNEIGGDANQCNAPHSAMDRSTFGRTARCTASEPHEDGGYETDETDDEKIDDAVLALLLLGRHDGDRAWKGDDWEAMNRLYEKGFISDPTRKGKIRCVYREGPDGS